MKAAKLTDIAEKMRGIDVGILSTHTEGGEIASRPMSNNGDVTYSGESFFFTYEEARCVADIERNPTVALGYTREGDIFSGSGVYIAVEGRAELIRDRSAFKEHWTPDLDRWFEQGIDTPTWCCSRSRRAASPAGKAMKRAKPCWLEFATFPRLN